MQIIPTIPVRQASLSDTSNAWPSRDMIDAIVLICHIKWYVIICLNKYYTQYVNNIKVVQTNQRADKAIYWYHTSPMSSINVIKRRVTLRYHAMNGAWWSIWGTIGLTMTMWSSLTSHNAVYAHDVAFNHVRLDCVDLWSKG